MSSMYSSERLSAQSQRIRRLKRLVGRSKVRSKERTFVVEGPTLVAEALVSDLSVRELFHAPGAIEEAGLVPAVSSDSALQCFEVDPSVLGSALDTVHPQPLAAVVEQPAEAVDGLASPGPVLVAAELRDPGNLGTIMRTTEAAGLVGLAMLGDSVDRYSPKVVRASAGSVLRLSIAEWRDPIAGLRWLSDHGRPLIAAVVDPSATPYDEIDLRQAAIMVGNEPRGLDDRLVAAADMRCTIPVAERVESLNVAAAAAVLSFEASRQHRRDSN